MWIIFSLLAALLTATVVTLSKAGLKNVSSNLGFAVQAVMILVVSWTVVFSQGTHKELVSIERRAWVFLLTAGVITCLSSLFTFHALKLGDASRVSPFDKISLVFSIILAAVFLKERITWQTIVGGLLMATGALIIALSSQAAKP